MYGVSFHRYQTLDATALRSFRRSRACGHSAGLVRAVIPLVSCVRSIRWSRTCGQSAGLVHVTSILMTRNRFAWAVGTLRIMILTALAINLTISSQSLMMMTMPTIVRDDVQYSIVVPSCPSTCPLHLTSSFQQQSLDFPRRRFFG